MGAGYPAWYWGVAALVLASLRLTSGFVYGIASPLLLVDLVTPATFRSYEPYFWLRVVYYIGCVTTLQLILPWTVLTGSVFGFKRRVNSARALLDRAGRAIGM